MELNPMNPTRLGFHWRYNVCQNSTPIPSMGRVFYADDGFGSLILVRVAQIVASLK